LTSCRLCFPKTHDNGIVCLEIFSMKPTSLKHWFSLWPNWVQKGNSKSEIDFCKSYEEYGITPLKSMQEVVGCCISTSLSIISFLSISSSFLLNFASCLTLFSSSYSILFSSSFCFLNFSSSSLNSCSNFSLSFCSLFWILIFFFFFLHLS